MPPFVLGRLEGLLDLDPREQFRGEDVEVEGAVARALATAVLGESTLPSTSMPFSCTRAKSGPRPRSEMRRPSPASRLICHARQALQRFGQVQFRELRHVFGDDRVGDDGGILLQRAGHAQRLAEAVHDDGVDGVRARIGRRVGGGRDIGGPDLGGMSGAAENGQGDDGRRGAHGQRLLGG
jgi:hypothetical protein